LHFLGNLIGLNLKDFLIYFILKSVNGDGDPQKYPQTKWGNPYAKYLKKLGRDRVIKMYEEYILNKPELMKINFNRIKGKKIGLLVQTRSMSW
jgi:hypothetical protein